MTKPVIWILSYFAGGPSYCPRVPDYSLAEYLGRNGYDPLVFAGSALHNTSTNFIEDGRLSRAAMVDGVPFVYVRTRSYEGRAGESASFVDYYMNLMKCYRNYPEPDLIIAAMPQPLACFAGERLAKKFGVSYITSIVDLWPLSIVEYAGFSENNPIIRAMYAYEKWLYKKSDQLVFTWEGAYDYIVDRGWEREVPIEKFHYINIGVNLKEFYANQAQWNIDDADLEDDTFKVMYCGSVRTANDIGTVVSCAQRLNADGYQDRVKFIIYGDGPDRVPLVKRCAEEGIPNVLFKGSIEKKYIPYVLSKSDLNILNLKPASTQKYGNSSNKLFEYFAAGNPVIANIDEGKYPIISRYKCGKVVAAGSPEAYAEGVEAFLKMSEEELQGYRDRALKTARLFDTEAINAEWERIIRTELQRRGRTHG